MQYDEPHESKRNSVTTPALTSDPNRNVLVTGASRSGTTFIERLVDAHPDACTASQPFPFFYRVLKSDWLSSHGWAQPYPLDGMFDETRYTNDDFTMHLAGITITTDWIRTVARSMVGYGGCWTPEILDQGDDFAGGTFAQVQASIGHVARRALGRPPALVCGSKEVFVEEYVPALLAGGSRVVLVVRDPRAVMASTLLGRGESYVGARRPLLFHLRNWRKSVAFLLAMRDHPNFLVVSYEDAISDPRAAAQLIYRHLGLEPFTVGDIVDQYGSPFIANSSFPGRSMIKSIDAWRAELDVRTIRFIESLCLPEMLALGYVPMSFDLEEADLFDYVETGAPDVADLSATMSSDLGEISRERERLAILAQMGVSHDSLHRRWFIFGSTEMALRTAVAAAK